MDVHLQSIFANYGTYLFHLIGFNVSAAPLYIDDFYNASSPETVMAASNALVEAEAT